MGDIDRQGDSISRELRIVVVVHLLVDLLILSGVEHVELLGDMGEAEVGGEVYLHVALLAVLRGDDDHAVGSHRAIDGSSGTILEYFHGLYVLWVDVVDVAGEAINDIQRLVVAKGLDATYLHAESGTGIATALENAHAGHLSFESLGGIGGGAFGQVGGVDRGNGSREVALLHRAITHDDNLVESLGVFSETDAHVVTCLGHKIFEADIAHDDIAAFWGVEGELAVDVGDGLDVGAPDLDGGTNDGFAVLVGDGAGDFVGGAGSTAMLGGTNGSDFAADDDGLGCDDVVGEVAATQRLIEDGAYSGVPVTKGDVRFVIDNLGLVGEAVGGLLLDNGKYFPERRILHGNTHCACLSIDGETRQHNDKQRQKTCKVSV